MSTSGRSIRILVLDDIAEHAEHIVAASWRGGNTAEWKRAATPSQLLDVLATEIFDVVLSDYWLDGLSAIDALRMVRERMPDVPFIIVSGSIGEELAVDAIKQGAQDFVLKERLSRLSDVVSRELELVEKARAQAHDSQERDRTLRDSEMFIGVLSHDLRNPLGAIVTGAAVLSHLTIDLPKAGATITRILRSAERMRRMIDQRLDFTRVRMGGVLPLAPA